MVYTYSRQGLRPHAAIMNLDGDLTTCAHVVRGLGFQPRRIDISCFSHPEWRYRLMGIRENMSSNFGTSELEGHNMASMQHIHTTTAVVNEAEPDI